MESQIISKTAGKSKEKLKEPENYKVILLNDHYTTMEFVVEVLVNIFHKTHKDAEKIMMDVHRKGKGTVGVYSWDIAETKAQAVHLEARRREYPLRCIVEPA